MIRRGAMLVLLCVLSSSVTAKPAPAPAPSSSLEWLVGAWNGRGTLNGQASEARLEVRPALAAKFVELSYRVATTGSQPFSFEGRAFYRPGGGASWTAHWFDSRGMSWPIAATAESGTLTADWGTVETERGRTVYRLLGRDRLEVVDTVLQSNGRWREFARHLFSKSR